MKHYVLLVLLLGPMSTARAADKKEVALHVFSWAATLADAEVTTAYLRHSTCHELNPLIGQHPNRATLYATTLPVAALLSWRGHEARRHHSKTWALGMLVNGTAHTSANIWNVKQGCY